MTFSSLVGRPPETLETVRERAGAKEESLIIIVFGGHKKLPVNDARTSLSVGGFSYSAGVGIII